MTVTVRRFIDPEDYDRVMRDIQAELVITENTKIDREDFSSVMNAAGVADSLSPAVSLYTDHQDIEKELKRLITSANTP